MDTEVKHISFLQPSIGNIKKSIRGIDDSYNNYWDILSELIQNSVDAINKKDAKSGEIDLFLDCQKKEISIHDDGIGIDENKLPNLLSLFSTDKEDDYTTIGEKGVGLKFVIFQSTSFKMITSYYKSKKTSYVTIQDAKPWKSSNSENDLDLKQEIKIDNKKGTEIVVSGIDNDELFNLSFDSLKYVLRTKTAIGNVLKIFCSEDIKDIEVNLKMIDINGDTFEEKIPYLYLLPIENLPITSICDLDDFEIWLKTDRTDAEKRNKLKDKIIIKKGEILHNGNRKIKYWSCFVPQRKVWLDLSEKFGLANKEMLDDDEVLANRASSIIQPGIYTSVKGMPTGISIEHPSTGNAGYWSNMFIIFEDGNLKFDIGRKSIPSGAQPIYKKYARDIFNKYGGIVTKYISGEPDIDYNPTWNRDDIKAEIDRMPMLDYNNIISFKNNPAEQEASVAAIFYELIGAKKITNLEPIISGYRNKYDLYANWNNHFVVIEFKSHLRNIMKDFDDVKKYSDEIDYIVCWDINDTDMEVLHDGGIDLCEMNDSVFYVGKKNYIQMATHKLIVSSSSKPIYVIDLKLVLKKIAAGQNF